MRYRLAARCPACGVQPSVYPYALQIEAVRDLPPDTPLHSYRCHIEYCEQRYDLTAGAYQRAQPVEASTPNRPPPVVERRKYREHVAQQVWRILVGNPALGGIKIDVRANSDALRLTTPDRSVAIERPDWWKPGTPPHIRELADDLARLIR